MSHHVFRFADRDLFMRFRGGGIGHALQHRAGEASWVSPNLFKSARLYPSYTHIEHEIDGQGGVSGGREVDGDGDDNEAEGHEIDCGASQCSEENIDGYETDDIGDFGDSGPHTGNGGDWQDGSDSENDEDCYAD